MAFLQRAFSMRFNAVVLSIGLCAASSAHPAHAEQGAAAQGSAQAPASIDLTMDRAVEMALEANLGLQANRLNVDSADHAVAAARAAFLPQLNTNLMRQSTRTVPGDFTQGTADITSQGVVFNSSFMQTLPLAGTQYSVAWNNNRRSQLGGNPLFSPVLSSSFALNVTQPLWRGLFTDANRSGLATSQRRRRVADLQFDQEIVRLEAGVKYAYLTLIGAREGLRVAQQNLAVRQRSLEDARARVEVGASAPIDLISAEAEVASNQEQVLIAEAGIATAEDALRTLILEPSRPDYWDVRINTIDTIQSEPIEIDLESAIRGALANRLDLISARQQMEISDLTLQLARDATRPLVNLNMQYGSSGTGGTRFLYEGFPPAEVGRVTRGFGPVLGDAFGAAYPNWTVGVSVQYPIGRNAADANYAQQQVAQRQSTLNLQELEIAVVRQVREAARQVQNSYQRVLVTRAARAASEQQLEAEERRFAAGLSTTLEQQVRQGQLASARNLELNAVIAYNRALIQFESVQKTQ